MSDDMKKEVLTPRQRHAVEKIQALQLVTERTGMRTTRSVNDILSTLGAEDLAQVARVVFKK